MARPPTTGADRPEALVVALAQTGDRDAFADLVMRRQSWLRNLMRRWSGDATLADDLAQQVFLQAWRHLPQLREPQRFGAWLRQLAVNVWLQRGRSSDALHYADPDDGVEAAHQIAPDLGMDLDRALAALSPPVRLCIVLSYHEGMTHEEIADLAGMPIGTVKSHIRRGTERLQNILSAYKATS